MKTARLLSSLICLIAIGLGVAHAAPNPEAANGGAFVHVVRNDGSPHDNTNIHLTGLVSEYPASKASPLTDSPSNAVIFATYNASQATAAQSFPYGVYLDTGRWYIFNTNGAHFPGVGGQAFNVQAQSPTGSIFVHTAFEGTITGNHTVLDHPLLNDNPAAMLSVTPTVGFDGKFTQKNIGVFYKPSANRWAIFNQDHSAMPNNAAFNVHILPDTPFDFRHVAAPATIVDGSKTVLDHPKLNSRPSALIIVTQHWSGVYNDNPIGVEYDNVSHRWMIVNANGSAMPQNAAFNVHIAATASYGDGALYNGGFEVTDYIGKQPVRWNTAKAGAGSKLVCNAYAPAVKKTKIVSSSGECSYLLKGAAGQTRKLVQTVDLAEQQMQPYFDFRLWAKKKGAGILKAKVKIKLDDGTTAKIGLPGAALNGKYNWKEISSARLLPPGTVAQQLTVIISLKDGGKVWLDHISGTFFVP